MKMHRLSVLNPPVGFKVCLRAMILMSCPLITRHAMQRDRILSAISGCHYEYLTEVPGS